MPKNSDRDTCGLLQTGHRKSGSGCNFPICDPRWASALALQRVCRIRRFQSLHQTSDENQSVKSCTSGRASRYWSYAPDFDLRFLKVPPIDAPPDISGIRLMGMAPGPGTPPVHPVWNHAGSSTLNYRVFPMDKCHYRFYYTENLGGLVTCTLGTADMSEPSSRTRVDRPCEWNAPGRWS
jgi:hypothetical protein